MKDEIIVVDEQIEDDLAPARLTRQPPTNGMTKLSAELVDIIRSYLQAGAPIRRAVLAAGVTEKTYGLWRQKGRARPDSAFAEAGAIFEQAISQSIVADIAFIRSGKTGWQARAWRLERCFPGEFALVNRLDTRLDAVHTLKIQWGNVPSIEASHDDSDDRLTETT